MANLSTALNSTLAGLSLSAAQSAVVSRNVASASDENYARRSAEIATFPSGNPAVARINRSADKQLLERLLSSGSEAAGKQVLIDALQRMSGLTGDPENDSSISAAVGKLQQALKSYETNPASTTLGGGVLEAAKSLVSKLNGASAEIRSIREEADKAMAGSAEKINNLLAQFKVLNDSVVRGQGTPDELLDALDQRDSVLKLLSEEIGIRTVMRPNNDVLIYAQGGAVLFEASPRHVSFLPADNLEPGITGNSLIIDGVPVTGAGAPMPLSHGRIAVYAMVRDVTAPQLSSQLDQIAAGLVRAFSETAPSLSTVEGLFKASGSVPDLGNPNHGLAAAIKINPLADPDHGGSILLLRDGGFGGPDYVVNANGHAGFQTRIKELADSLDAVQNFPVLGGLGGNISLKTLSLQSASWVETQRQTAQRSLDLSQSIAARASDSLARVTGVNIDQEMAALLDLEKSYQASSKVLTVVDSMLASLMEAVS
ncbi:MAG: flagellar hook-associated protein FlgK [Aestuariivirga sp.]|uniref:flagellar hook-associated protein FlgK n=1 Tax=Aestuariivirga sp. TaxID=2650926 RepID=UPI0038D227EA